MKTILFTLIICSLCPPLASATELEDLKQRVDELERRQQESFQEFHASKGFVRPFLKDGILLGGYFESGFTHIIGPDTRGQYSTNSHLLGINLSAEFTEQDRFVMQLQSGLGYTLKNPHNDPTATPAQREFSTPAVVTILSQGFFEHRFSPGFNVQTGLGYTPFGNAFQQRELILFKRRGGPNMLKSSSPDNVGIAFPLWMGIHVHGSTPVGENELGYNAYTFSPNTKSSSVGGGTRLWYRYQDMLTMGLSHQIGEQEESATYQSYGADMDFKFEKYGVTLEYARTDVSHGNEGPESYYVTPYYNFLRNRLIVYATADYLDHPNNMTAAVTADPFEIWSVGGGINWLPLSNVRIRFGYLNQNYVGTDSVIAGQERDHHSFDLSLGLGF